MEGYGVEGRSKVWSRGKEGGYGLEERKKGME